MVAYQFSRIFNLSTVATILFLMTNRVSCSRVKSELIDDFFLDSFGDGFSDAVATWYGDANGAGSGGACGFGDDVSSAPYHGMITAGNQFLFKSGKGCGNCFQVKCTEKSYCSGNAITVTLTDECPGSCNNEHVHFDLSGKAFGYLAKSGQEQNLRQLGRINILYQSVPCKYNVGITIKIDSGSNRNYLAFAVESVDGDGDVGSVEISSSNSNGWLTMQQSWGATWKVGLPEGIRGPYSVKVTTIESRQTYIKTNAIPENWAAGAHYRV